MLKAHNHAFWIYGVIVGLAIREALTRVLPHAIPLLAQGAIAATDSPHHEWLEAIRLITFLAVIIRFYLGAGIYFDEAYCADTADTTYPTKNYGMDFLAGIVHFIFFFAWSETLIGHEHFAHGLSGFLLILGMVLLYDSVWWLLNLKYSTKITIRIWALLNAGTFVVAYFLLLLLNTFAWFGDKTNETICLLPVGVMTVFDYGEMFGKRNPLTNAIVDILSKVGVKS